MDKDAVEAVLQKAQVCRPGLCDEARPCVGQIDGLLSGRGLGARLHLPRRRTWATMCAPTMMGSPRFLQVLRDER